MHNPWLQCSVILLNSYRLSSLSNYWSFHFLYSTSSCLQILWARQLKPWLCFAHDWKNGLYYFVIDYLIDRSLQVKRDGEKVKVVPNWKYMKSPGSSCCSQILTRLLSYIRFTTKLAYNRNRSPITTKLNNLFCPYDHEGLTTAFNSSISFPDISYLAVPSYPLLGNSAIRFVMLQHLECNKSCHFSVLWVTDQNAPSVGERDCFQWSVIHRNYL